MNPIRSFAVAAALLALASTDVAAACKGLPAGIGLKMPPPKMWVAPPKAFARISCEKMGEVYAAMRHMPLDKGRRENRDCHLLGAWLSDGDPLANMVYGPLAGKIVVTDGLPPAVEFMVRVHENAHRQFGWRDEGPGKSYTLAQWIAAAPPALVRGLCK